MGENFIEQHSSVFERAQAIAENIKGEFETLSEEAKEALETNQNLDEAVRKYGGLPMMLNEGMRFRAFSSGAVNDTERIMSYGDFRLAGYLAANKERINIQNLEKLLEVFKERKIQILEALKTPVTKESAMSTAESIHKDLVLKTLETEPVFG